MLPGLIGCVHIVVLLLLLESHMIFERLHFLSGMYVCVCI